MAAPQNLLRLITRAARMLTALKGNPKHPRRAEYKAQLEACRKEWAALSKAERGQATRAARDVPDMCSEPTLEAVVSHLEG